MVLVAVWPILVGIFTSVAPAVLLVTASIYLWHLRWQLSHDRSWLLPLPPGSMGLPIVGETLHWLLQGCEFHSSRRRQHGHVFKTHLLGRPVVRVSGAALLPPLLLEETSRVGVSWPRSAHDMLGPHSLANSSGHTHRARRKVYARVFSQAALDSYLPQIVKLVREAVTGWCARPGPVSVYPENKRLTLRIAAAALLGSLPSQEELTDLFTNMEQLSENIFTLPIDVPGSGYRKGIRARDKLHQYLGKVIEARRQAGVCEDQPGALGILARSSKEQGMDMGVQELTEAAVELMFAAFATTASAATSLVLQLIKHPAVVAKLREELQTRALGAGALLRDISRLRYLDNVVKEVLRVLPPVSGGYRVALHTFELAGFQIPKGWSVLYSIRDTHNTSPIFQDLEEFNPDRFDEDQMKSKNLRFHYLPFGDGVRRCLGKELAKLILKVFAIELVRVSHWELTTRTFPKMLLLPIVHPADGLQVRFFSSV
ncbi:cytochrome P450 26B1-like [Leucoraja erinacea]|uniref:cytochrome P450 26B1-like n=1 Tax=Leucoraja erinaceus TaxID=7782 RepID=UPI00245612C6|nr:cytochrome P450 26B1-like [Leucoraja erinacea]